MNIELKATSDEFFSIGTIKHAVTPETPKTPELGDAKLKELGYPVMETPQTNAAPLENSKEGHPFDPFGGTSWSGKRNGFN